jgi:putative hydrolase of the HAD superfamily
LRAAPKEALFGHADWRTFDRGTLSESDLIERLQLRLGATRKVDTILDAVRNSLLEKPETVELLRALQAQGTPLHCLSNMPASIYNHLRQRHGFWDAFSGVVISGEVKLMKPEPEVFHHLLAAFNLRAPECVFIDDLPANIESARQVGLHAICFKDAAQCRRELEQILGNWRENQRGKRVSRVRLFRQIHLAQEGRVPGVTLEILEKRVALDDV